MLHTYTKIIAALLLLTVVRPSAAATLRPETVDSLLTVYHDSPYNEKDVSARQIVDLCMKDEQLIDKPLHVEAGMAEDSMNLMVWFAAARYYY